MSWIVVLESEGRQADRIRDALAVDGWQVELTSTPAAAAAAMTARSAQLLIANVELPGAAELLDRHARARGGPGTLAVVAVGKTAAGAAEGADGKLSPPLDDNELRLNVRRLVTAGRAPKTVASAEEGSRLTSRDLFGDMLAEVEGGTSAPVKAPAAKPAAPSAYDQSLDQLFKTEKPRPAPVRKESPGVEDLLSRTLSGLDVGERVRRPAAPKPETAPVTAKPPAESPAAPVPQAAAPSAAESAGAASPKSKERPAGKPAEALKPAAPPSPVKPAVDRSPGQAKSTLETTPAKRTTRDLDLSSLDALAKGKGREKTPTAAGVFATQKISLPATLRAGATPVEFGQYTLLERIALGGMAEVWKARRKGVEGFQKTVAIKKILPHLTDSSDFVTMFIDEAKLAAQLNHTNIIHIYDLGKIGDDFFIAMEFVDGRDLRSILNASRDRKQPLPLGLSLLVASRLASALDYAHRKRDFEGHELGLVHRDVSPQNVLISFEGDIKLCDFGIVKAVSKASKTQMGALKGKLQYMSPEQAWGRPVDARSDIFSLGTLLFEMLTGQRLFSGESEMSVLDAVREGRVQAPRDFDPRLPLEVNALVLKALAREPKDRFSSAGDMHREIDGILSSIKPAPTQNDLALLVQRLFDAEGRQAALAPKAPETPAAPESANMLAAPSAPTPSAVKPVATPAFAPEASRPDAALESAPAGGRTMLWIGVAAAVVVGGLTVLLLGRGGSEPTPDQKPTPAPTELAAPAAETPAPPAKTAAVTTPGPAATPPAPAAAPEAAAAKPAETVPAAVVPAGSPAENDAKKRAEAERKKAEAAAKPAPAESKPSAPPAVQTPPPTASSAAAPTAATALPTGPAPSAPIETAPVEPAVVEAPATRPAPVNAPIAAPAKAPATREGDLVTAGAGVRAPVLVSFNKPEYPPIARRMRVEGTVVLSLLVDETGRVADVRLDRGVSQNVGINEAALAAARTARFQPPTKDGVRVKMWHTLTIPFKL